MNGVTCERESELLDALGAGFVGAELESHVSSCASCRELRLVAGALLDDHSVALSEANVPGSGTMWWRMQIRRRQEARAKAQKTLLAGQAATLVVALALVIMLLGPEVLASLREMIATIRLSTPLLVALASWVLLAPVAGWAALRSGR